MTTYTHLLVGAGLHNGLTALALRRYQPQARVALIERGTRPGGNHTWCFHGGADPDAEALLGPLVAWRWSSQDVRFPDFERTLDSAYAGFGSDALATALEAAFAAWPGSELICEAEVVDVGPHTVTLADGRTLSGDLVIDGRGPERLDLGGAGTGYQKFVGLDVELAAPHGVARPLLMDATVPQRDGFRFLYVLPLGPRRLLVEDTRFSLEKRVDASAWRADLIALMAARGWHIARELRAERGVLPMPWGGQVAAPAASPVLAGFAGGWLHPATGYSLPVAVRFALAVAAGPADAVFERLIALHRDVSRRQPYMYRLNRLLFQCFDPEDMWHVFARFYRKPQPLIERFYALRSTPSDRTRMFLGRPPKGVKLARALAILR